MVLDDSCTSRNPSESGRKRNIPHPLRLPRQSRISPPLPTQENVEQLEASVKTNREQETQEESGRSAGAGNPGSRVIGPDFSALDFCRRICGEGYLGAHAPSRAVTGALAGNRATTDGQDSLAGGTLPDLRSHRTARARSGTREGACAPLCFALLYPRSTIFDLLGELRVLAVNLFPGSAILLREPRSPQKSVVE